MERSILENSQVDNGSWLMKDLKPYKPTRLAVVGGCPKCGAPVYGPREVPAGGEGTVNVRHSCTCAERPQSFQDTMQLK